MTRTTRQNCLIEKNSFKITTIKIDSMIMELQKYIKSISKQNIQILSSIADLMEFLFLVQKNQFDKTH